MGQGNSQEEAANGPDRICRICLKVNDQILSPRVLVCGHEFCHKCIKLLYNKRVQEDYSRKGVIFCPVCSKEFPIASNGPVIIAKGSASASDVTISSGGIAENSLSGEGDNGSKSFDNKAHSSVNHSVDINVTDHNYSPDQHAGSNSTDHNGDNAPNQHVGSNSADQTDDSSSSEAFFDAEMTIEENAGESTPATSKAQGSDEHATKFIATENGFTLDKTSLKRRRTDSQSSEDAPEEMINQKTIDFYFCSSCITGKKKRKKAEVSFCCFGCVATMCDGCKQRHDLRPICQGHVVCPVNREAVDALICKDHNELAEDYCNDCACVTCAECHMDKHRDHVIGAFTVKPIKSAVFDEIEKLKSRNRQLEALMESKQTEFNIETQQVKEEMKKTRNEMINRVHAAFEQMFMNLETRRSEWNARLQEIRTTVEVENAIADELNERCNQLVSPVLEIPSLHILDAEQVLAKYICEIPQEQHIVQSPPRMIYIPPTGPEPRYGQLGQIKDQHSNVARSFNM